MLNIKVFKVLQSIGTKTMNRFQKYVISPYFNVNQELIKLFEIYQKIIKSPKDKIEIKDVWSMLYSPNTAFDDKKIRQLNTKLLSLFEDFIAQERFNNETLTKAYLQLEQLQNRDYQLIENQIIKNSNKIGERYQELSSSYHLKMYQIENAYYFLTNDSEKKSKKKSKLEKFNFEEILKHLDTFYLAEKLKFIYIQLFWESYNPGDKSDLLNDEILALVNKGKFRSNELLLSHYYAIRTITNPDKEKYYNSLKELVFKIYNDFDQNTIRFFYDCLLTYCIRRVNAGYILFEAETFELYKIGLKRDLFLINDEMSIISFRNIIGIGLKQHQFDWTGQFIIDYAGYIPKELRENAVNFNLARVNFRKNNFDSALINISKVDLDDIHYTLIGRTLLIAIYYELNEFEALISTIDSFRVFLNRTKILSKTRIDNFKNYLKFTKKMAILEPSDKSKIKKLYEDVSNNRTVNKQWILDKIKELGYEPVSV